MTIRVAINHRTTYQFDRRTKLNPHILRLRPAPHSRTKIHSYSLKVLPKDHFINWQQDPFGNYLARLVFSEASNVLDIHVEVIADLDVINPFDYFIEEYAKTFPFTYPDELSQGLKPYLEKIPAGEKFAQWIDSIPKEASNTNDFLVSINQKLEKEIEYGIRMEPGVQTPEETLTRLKGSCRDSAWLLVQIFRHLGLAARFVSGYLVQLTSDEKPLEGPDGPKQDFTDLHAWAEVYIPGAGWVGLDPTSGLFASEGHIPLACTPDPRTAAPIEGSTDLCEVAFSFSNQVTRIKEDPRVTKPYQAGEWGAILELGDQIDSALESKDVRLTMGGEPTFVSIDDRESNQWHTEALGTHKLALAKDLTLRLREQFAPNGLLHFGQGKWYPGEEIPRWALGCFWRTDGQPMWHNPNLLGFSRNSNNSEQPNFQMSEVFEFSSLLCGQLGIDSDYLIPAYEDAMYYLWKEQSLPANLDLEKADLKDDLARKRLARILSQGLDEAVGVVIPLRWCPSDQRPLAEAMQAPKWQTSRWPIRGEKLTLCPGDSPIGLRLPLESLPLAEQASEGLTPERDPFQHNEPLGIESKRQEANVFPASISTNEIIRTALCIEVRGGEVFIFIPPIHHLEHYISLIQSIEQVAEQLQIPITLEGYEPPKDPRINKLLVTPDPGVIEVNIHPAKSWRDQVHITKTLYEVAKQSRLSAEKFMLDGRHSGTGGGNHITLGGASPMDSPFIRRPDLLQSFITYWQHHPSLSYLFSGLFIGPTSQSPRVDEGRDEALYELEIAFSQLPKSGADKPWLVDRILRNLLIDVTGNTHRTEFCIDKLYAPGSASGRQGIVELRGFEMPPHWQMSLVQTLLVRCLLARFWDKPYQKQLVRWGTELHDRFLLPHYVWKDLQDVVADLNQQGYPFKLDWLTPFYEFRFPRYGRIQLDDIGIEIRSAIEPWHVLGEEVGSMGTARYVDSSVERVQLKLNNFIEARYIVTCNGRRMPVIPTGRKGEYVIGVRYRAWQPFSALHPTINTHSPLVFDIIDTWNHRSIGGCTYHVSHPGGLSYEQMPVNAAEAESRRHNRFDDLSHTQAVIKQDTPLDLTAHGVPVQNINHSGNLERSLVEHRHQVGQIDIDEVEASIDYPHTFDLRRT